MQQLVVFMHDRDIADRIIGINGRNGDADEPFARFKEETDFTVLVHRTTGAACDLDVAFTFVAQNITAAQMKGVFGLVGQDQRLKRLGIVRQAQRPAVFIQKAPCAQLINADRAPLAGCMPDPLAGGFHHINEGVLRGPISNAVQPEAHGRFSNRAGTARGQDVIGGRLDVFQRGLFDLKIRLDQRPNLFCNGRIGTSHNRVHLIQALNRLWQRALVQGRICHHRGQQIGVGRAMRRIVGIEGRGRKIGQRRGRHNFGQNRRDGQAADVGVRAF